ncbi:hypothetical protein ABM90_31380 [Rhodococcus erythropolis]|nr:hypothetical protein ABM90_31380 [Rhodococcus erythropolis]
MSDGEVKLSAGLPRGEQTNGLSSLAGEMASMPEGMHVAVIVFDTKSIKIDTDTGDAVPTARIRRVEPIVAAADRQRLLSLVTRAFEQRTGKTVLPLELEDELRSAFDGGRQDPKSE